ncbi:hypothetical protein K443DRAFT_483026 [Laccaria amethystina LaAM-08-1]|uniref:Uncharacterized protein n=1 Tax=Laccaria amethystina LaAM-08-1 TaxID=1095629 RepID=A0A0C9WS63_9AGAR|nr:hypothetical protein K443DRAFT_516795 [Laccaria amethystina LaAM-08-1]KIJ91471.1 hypothetical protein K443DRAFT_483026 [Laccaria amethystina LaAM-08-1]
MSNFSATPNFRQFQGLIHLSLVEVRENHCGRPQVSSLSDGHLNHQVGDFSSQHRPLFWVSTDTVSLYLGALATRGRIERVNHWIDL